MVCDTHHYVDSQLQMQSLYRGVLETGRSGNFLKILGKNPWWRPSLKSNLPKFQSSFYSEYL